MTDIKAEALHWIRSYKNFPQLHSVNKAGFPIGRTTWFPIEDDWSIHATGYHTENESLIRIYDEREDIAGVIDESGEDYLYPASCFIDANLSKETQAAVVKAA